MLSEGKASTAGPKLKPIRITQSLFRILNFVERAAAYAQGKGYGAVTIEQEVRQLLLLLKTKPRLAIDVGGNVGDYTAELRRRNARLDIHTFEPSATNVA